MFTVTDAALERLAGKLAEKQAGEQAALRITRVSGRWRLRVDRVRPTDASFAYQGRPVLLLDHAAAESMEAMTLTVRETKRGTWLRLRRSDRTKE